MKTLIFAKRNMKEISRDLLSLFFGVAFPILLLLLLTLIQSNIPGDAGPFAIEKLAPGIAIFSLSFVSLFSGLLISKDPAALLFIGMGILCGSLFNEKQVGGACGALLTNISAWLSGIWFDVALVGGWFETIANALPFVHAVNVGRFIIAHDYTQVFPELLWVIGYTIVIIGVSIYIFMKKVNH